MHTKRRVQTRFFYFLTFFSFFTKANEWFITSAQKDRSVGSMLEIVVKKLACFFVNKFGLKSVPIKETSLSILKEKVYFLWIKIPTQFNKSVYIGWFCRKLCSIGKILPHNRSIDSTDSYFRSKSETEFDVVKKSIEFLERNLNKFFYKNQLTWKKNFVHFILFLSIKLLFWLFIKN